MKTTVLVLSALVGAVCPAAELFNGGGHKNASGGESQLGLEETKQILIQALPRYFKH